MSKAIEGAALIAGVIGAEVLTAMFDPALTVNPAFQKALFAIGMAGVSMEAGSIAQALTSNRGMNITTRQPASYRQIIRGEQRVGGVEVYRNTTGGHHDQFNYIIVVATHVIDSFVNLYLDGRQVFWDVGSVGNTTRNGVNFGGSADGNDHIGPNGAHYNFGGKVYCEARFGDQLKDDVIGGATANDPNWDCSADGCPWLGGCAYCYLKIEFSTTQFPGEPEIRFTIRGKNDILDPRTGTRGYTHNWALHVADHIADPQYGINDAAAINQAQLIAAANVCDEQVALAAGSAESRYALHMHYDTGMAPGDVLQQMMPPAMGRISRIGGEWFIWPAYWQGPSFAFDQSMLLSAPQWNPVRSFRDLSNRVTGTYTAPNFPYNVAGNLYDSNGWYDGSIADNFPYAFQPTSYPMYAADQNHGYATDQYLDEDGGVQLPTDLSMNNCLSIAQAQRCAKIHLLRNRQQGVVQMTMGLAAWQMQPVDVMNFTFPALTWANKTFEIDSVELRFGPPPSSDEQTDDQQAQAIFVVVQAIETDASVYQWSTTEELTAYNVPAKLTMSPYVPVAPPSMSVESSAGTALIGADGVVTPRALVKWGVPMDKLVTQIQIQFQLFGASAWTDSSTGLVAVDLLQAFVTGVVANQVYNFRIRSVRASSGATSDWVEQDSLTISTTLSNFANTGLNPVAPPGTLSSQSLSIGTAQIVVQPFTATFGSLTANCLPSGAVTLTGYLPSQLYYVFYIDPSFVGGAIALHVTQNTADFQDKIGYWLIGAIITASDASGAGLGRYSPSSFSDTGGSTTTTPTAAYDRDATTAAMVNGRIGTVQPNGGGNCLWRNFPNLITSVTMTLFIDAQLITNACVLRAYIGGSPSTPIIVANTDTARTVYQVTIPAGTDVSVVWVNGQAGMQTSGTKPQLNVWDIYIQ